jgi:DNA repair exonuclease SbcCD ATPase subunit
VSEPTTFLSLRIEAFRGFRDAQEFTLAGSAVIASGPNGTGKTSFFDAMQWLLLGSLKRLENLQLKAAEEYIVNQYRLPGPAVVEGRLVLGGETVRLKRTGSSRSTLLEWEGSDGRVLRGEDAEQALAETLTPSSAVTLESALLTAGLLQQDVMRAVLEAKANERYEVLNKLLGLDALEGFERAVTEWTKTAADAIARARGEEDTLRKQREQAEARLAALEIEAAARPTAALAQSELQALLEASRSHVVAREGTLVAGQIERFAADVRVARSLLRRAIDDLEAIRLERGVIPDEEMGDVGALETALDRLKSHEESRRVERAAAAQAATDAEGRSSEFARLAALVIPLLSDACPVCGQAIQPHELARELQERASDTADLVALREAASRAEALEKAATAERMAADVHLSNIRAQVTLRAALAGRERDALGGLVSGLKDLETITITLPTEEPEKIPTLRATLLALEQIDSSSQRVVAALELATGSDEAKRLRADVETLRQSEDARRSRTAELARRQIEAKNLQEATVTARIEVGRRRVETLRPLMADIYSRLDPHPSFKDLDIEHDMFRKRGTVTAVARDTLMGAEANPLLIFSSSQANIAALSYFLSLGWTAGDSGVPFVLLDDPLQSMDDVNVLGFADLCRFIRAERQLILSTHERRFASLLERKLAPRKSSDTTIVLTFRGWDRSGPQIDVEEMPVQNREIEARLAVA